MVLAKFSLYRIFLGAAFIKMRIEIAGRDSPAWAGIFYPFRTVLCAKVQFSMKGTLIMPTCCRTTIYITRQYVTIYQFIKQEQVAVKQWNFLCF